MLLPQLKFKRSVQALTISSALLALSACGGGSDNPRFIPTAANAYLLTSANRIVPFDLNDTQFARTGQLDLSSLFATGENAVDLDFRLNDGLIYILTRTNTNTAQLYAVSTAGTLLGKATLESPAGAVITLNTSARYSLEIHPQTEALQIIASNGEGFTSAANFDIKTSFNSSTNTSAPLVIAADPAYVGESLGIEATAIACDGSSLGLQTSKLVNINSNTSLPLSPTPIRSLSLDSELTTNQLVALLDTGAGANPFRVSATGVVTALPALPILASGETYTELALIVGAASVTCP